LKGDELRMCQGLPDAPRPDAFTAPDGSRRAVITFRRVKSQS
jgi:hypothetical protein